MVFKANDIPLIITSFRKSMELQKKLENLKKQVKKTLGADNNSTLKGNTMSRTFKKCKSLTTFKAMNFGFPKTTKPAKTSGLPKPSSPTKAASSDKTCSQVTKETTNLESVSLVTHPVHKLSRSSPYGGLYIIIYIKNKISCFTLS